jgi:hypothetical protein
MHAPNLKSSTKANSLFSSLKQSTEFQPYPLHGTEFKTELPPARENYYGVRMA